MTLSQFTVFVLTFIAFGALVVFVKKNRQLGKDTIIYSIGDKDFIEDNEEADMHKLLHVEQIAEKIRNKEELMVVEVPFPYNGRDFIIKLVKVLNYNSAYSNAELVQKDDDHFWVLISEGAIDTNSITIEINSYLDIDIDVEFYGYKNSTDEL